MSTDTATSVTSALPAAATAVAQAWGLGDALTASEPATSSPIPEGFSGQGVVIEITGRTAGKIAVIVDGDISQQLLDSPAAPPDLITALGPATTAACLALGDVHAGSSQVLDAASAGAQTLALADHGWVALSDDNGPRAIVAVGADTAEAGAADAGAIPEQAQAPQRTAHVDPPAGRLDMLRGVHMEATVELGRTSMTINDLLALRSGSVIELDRAAGAPVDLYVNGRLIAHGEVVVVDENYGLRIQRVISDDTNG